MSVSAFNQSTAPSLKNASLADAKASTKRPAAASTAQLTTGINFTSQSSHCGPVFGGPPPRPLPDNLRPNPGPPPRPSPALPDPHYSKRSNEQLAQELLNNYKAFKGGWPPRTVTRQSLQKMADRLLTDNPDTDAPIRLARELLKRPGLMQALDRNGSTGALDGRLTKDGIRSFIASGNSLKLSSDKQLVQEMLKNFNSLKGSCSSTIKLSELSALAKESLTGDPLKDPLIELSREVMARSDLQSSMDNVFSWRRDGEISRQELFALLR